MAFGLLSTGFSRQRLPEVLIEILANLKAKTGFDFDSDAQSATGQFIGTFSEREAALWELAEAIYSAMYPISAIGKALDDAVSFVGVRRFPAARTLVPAIMFTTGTAAPTVFAGSAIRFNDASGNFLLDQDTQIVNTAQAEMAIRVAGHVNGTTSNYGITVNETAQLWSITDLSTASGIEAARVNLKSKFSSYPDVDVVMEADAFVIRSLNGVSFNARFAGANFSRINYLRIGSIGLFYREDIGTDAPGINSAITQVGSASGWAFTRNPYPAYAGRLEETDAELRSRYAVGVYETGAGTVDTIIANLFKRVPNLQTAVIYENTTTGTVDSVPAHSFEIVLEGGENNAIAKALLAVKPSGIRAYGTTSITVKDSNNQDRVIGFTRATPIYAWLEIVITKYDEETLTASALDDIETAIVKVMASNPVGKDIIPQRFVGIVFGAAPGIKSVSVKAATTTLSTDAKPVVGNFTDSPIAVGNRFKAVYDYSRINVSVQT